MSDEIIIGDIVLVPARVLMVYQMGDAHLQIEALSYSGKPKTVGFHIQADKLTKVKNQNND